MDEGLTVKPWKRYGKNRDYVVDGGGRSLGFRDNANDSVHVVVEEDRPAVLRALGIALPGQRPAQEDYAVTIDRFAVDLGDNAAGAGAKALAQEHREQAPVRTLLARVLGVHTDERAWRVGAKGEETVGRELERLGEAWTVVHDVPVGERGANIDHVVVGPAGVFTVNSKWHAGKGIWVGGDVVMVDGHRQPYVRNARHEARRASRLLSAAYGAPVPVLGIVAILAQGWTVREQPRDGEVLVTTPRTARKHLQKLPARYAVHEVDRLALWARRSTTWQP
ncbi:MAG: nuclease-related domain-containing protein [Mycobacteriales bacterium]